MSRIDDIKARWRSEMRFNATELQRQEEEYVLARLETAEKALRQLVDAYYNTESIEKFESLVQRADEIVREEK